MANCWDSRASLSSGASPAIPDLKQANRSNGVFQAAKGEHAIMGSEQDRLLDN
jgi:hypothetical protein